MGRRSSKALLTQAMFAVTRALEAPVTLPEAPDTYVIPYTEALTRCRKMAADYGFGEESFLDNRIRGRLHGILLAKTDEEARRLQRRVVDAVEVHLLLVAHRAGRLRKSDVEEAPQQD